MKGLDQMHSHSENLSKAGAPKEIPQPTCLANGLPGKDDAVHIAHKNKVNGP